MPVCAVVRCKAKKKPYHSFPAHDKQLIEFWKSCVCNPTINLLSNKDICSKYFVCDNHFVDSCKLPGTKGLKKFSIPTINVPGCKYDSNLNIAYNSYIAKQEKDPINQCLKNITQDHNYVDTVLIDYNARIENEDLDNCTFIDLSSEKEQNNSIKEVWIEHDLQLNNQNLANMDAIDPLINAEISTIQENVDVDAIKEEIITMETITNPLIIFNPENEREMEPILPLKKYSGPKESIEDVVLKKTKSHVCCSVRGCNNKYGSLHKFPADPILCKKWTDSLRFVKTVKDHMRVCSLHFRKSDFFPIFGHERNIKSKRRNLKKTAVPFICGKEIMQHNNIICTAKNCFNNKNDHENINFFPFPEDEKLSRTWALNSDREDLLIRKKFYKERYLCAKHFEPTCFKRRSKTEFKSNIEIIPTVFNNSDSVSLTNHPTDLYSYEDSVSIYNKEEKINTIVNDNKTHVRSNVLQTYINDLDTTKITLTDTFNKSSTNFDFGKINYAYALYEDFVSNPGVLNLRPHKSDNLFKKEYCRLCAKLCSFASLIPIFNKDGKFTIFGEMLQACFPEKIHLQDKLPQWMCSKCEYKLNECCSSIKEFIKAADCLRNILDINYEPDHKDVTDNIKFVKEFPANLNSESVSSINADEIDEQVNTNGDIPPNIPPEINKIIEEKQIEENNKYQCLNCDQLYNTKKELIDHSLVSHDTDRVKNIVCKIIPGETKPKMKHDKSETKIKSNGVRLKLRYECVVCSSLHEKKDSLVKHTLRYHPLYSNGKIVCRVVPINNLRNKHLTCLHCNEVFKNILKYRKHMLQHFKFHCEECGMHFTKMSQLKSHVKIHRIKTFRCIKCFDVFEEKSELIKHELIHKQPVFTETKCSICDEECNTASELFKHKKKHGRSLCNICGKLFSSSTLLKYHLEKHSNVRSHTCAICSKTFRTSVCLKRHKKIHSTDNKCVCQICGKQFGYLSVLTSHMYTHSAHKSHICELCGAGFHRKSNLLKHLRTHENIQENVYKCKICQKELKSRIMYIRHKQEHANDKKAFTCDICSKKFLTKFQVKIHRRIHTGETPYNCEQCGKSFRSLALMKQHNLIHMNVFPHQCNFCDRKFRRLQSLVVHRRTHTGEKPYPCPICGRAFANRSDMNKHKRNLHNRKNKQPNESTKNNNFTINTEADKHVGNENILYKKRIYKIHDDSDNV